MSFSGSDRHRKVSVGYTHVGTTAFGLIPLYRVAVPEERGRDIYVPGRGVAEEAILPIRTE